ncbi:hypothetical protein ECLT68_4668 [Escherichia coli LT-68]|nr:hypothetical protein ECLT68_4668 [Escherichia coli LT-68]
MFILICHCSVSPVFFCRFHARTASDSSFRLYAALSFSHNHCVVMCISRAARAAPRTEACRQASKNQCPCGDFPEYVSH